MFGDSDCSCSLLGTRRWIKSLNWKITRPWEPWLVGNHELVGYKIGYDNYNLVTILGEGHNAMFNKPDIV